MLRFSWISLVCVSVLPAQASMNVDFLGRLDSYFTYSDVWGYRAPNGKEYALLGADVGTSVIDCTVPTNPVETGFIPGPLATLRDIKTFGSYAYVVTEGGPGIQIIDLTDADNPSLVTTWGTSDFGRAHNLAIDLGTGWIYAVGTDVGTVVYDASTTPTAPPLVGVYGSPVVTTYIHDLAVQNGVGHAAMVFTGQYRLLDVTTWPFQTLSEQPSAAIFAHNVWPGADDQLAVTTDEQEGGVVELWDVSDPTAPASLAAYSVNTLAVPHNAFLVGDLCHVSWYTEGYRVLDVSDPTEPVEIGFFDTFEGPAGTQDGAFGVYPFQPSGTVYVSDRNLGLLVFRPHALRIHHDALPHTDDEDGPYTVLASPTSTDPIDTVTLWWSDDGVNFASVAAAPTANPGEYAADIPGHLAPRTLFYYLTATDTGGGSTRYPSPFAPETLLQFDVGTRIEVYSDGFETPSGWATGASTGTNDWERGATAALGGYSRVAWLDAQTARTGNAIWGNDIGLGVGADGAYAGRSNNWLQSPPIPTGGEQGLQLELWRWLSVEAFDRARVLVNGQVVWQNPSNRDLQEFRWRRQVIDVSSITDTASTATLRFELQTGADKELGGWNLDDVSLYVLGDCVPPVHYGAATPGSGAFTPQIATTAPPRIGTSFDVTGSLMLGGSAAVLVLGVQPASIPILGITLNVAFAGAVGLPVPVSGPAGPGNGTASVQLDVPAVAILDDADLFTQWLVVDAGAPAGGLAGSEGMRIRVCRR